VTSVTNGVSVGRGDSRSSSLLLYWDSAVVLDVVVLREGWVPD
jgi:hypothetical protein